MIMAGISVPCVVCNGTGERPTGSDPVNCYHCDGSGWSALADVDIAVLETRLEAVENLCAKILDVVDKKDK
jgi:DnaJ-class molecular chaperone